jgi:hypothetical protein
MKTRTKISFIFLILALTMTTCSATVDQSVLIPTTAITAERAAPPPELNPVIEQPEPSKARAAQESAQSAPTPTIYLPFVADRFPSIPPFGVDGRGAYDRMKAANVSWLRLNAQLQWSEIEAVQGTLDWSKASHVDTRLIDAYQNGLTAILLIQNAPGWARKYPNSACGPIREDKFADFGNFLHQVVQRYSQHPYNVKYYQIWNEPDAAVNESAVVFGCWAENTDETYGGRHYGKMLSQVYPRMKAANSNAQVIMGSLMMLCDPRDPNPENYCADTAPRKSGSFFKGVLETGKNGFDMVMFNSGPSYTRGENPVWSEMNNWRWKKERGGLVDGKINYLRVIMAAHGIDRPIIHSEAYLVDRPDDMAQIDLYEDYKADYLVWVYANGWSRNLKAVVWYSIEGWKGSELIVNGKDETKAFKALSTMIHMTNKTQSISRSDYSGFTRFIFHGNGEDIWLLVPTGKTYGASYSFAKPAKFNRALNMYGEEQTMSGSTIPFNRPIYVIVSR